MRLDQYIMELGLVESRNRAQELIKEGSVLLNEEICNKPAKEIKKGARVSILEKRQWVSRGGKKLFDALKSFEIKVEGKTALDVGSSTGGFTQVLLQEGATKIIAVDVGTNQLHASLRNVPRISILENTDIRDVSSKLVDFFGLNNNSKVLALKYRPKVLKDLIGQDVITETIFNSIKEILLNAAIDLQLNIEDIDFPNDIAHIEYAVDTNFVLRDYKMIIKKNNKKFIIDFDIIIVN